MEPILGWSTKIGDIKRAIPTRYSFGSVEYAVYLVKKKTTRVSP